MPFPWYFGSISRLRAEELLLNSKKNGSFLIRVSENIPDAHVLCVLELKVSMCKILQKRVVLSAFQLMENIMDMAVPGAEAQAFDRLENLVTFYSQANKGLPHELKQPAVSEEYETADDETDDEDDDLDEADGKQDQDDYDFLSAQTIIDNMDQIQSNTLDRGFRIALGKYLGDGLKRDQDTVSSGGAVLDGLQTLLASTSTGLIEELQCFLSKLDMLQKVFNLEDEDKLKCLLPDHSNEVEPSFKLLMDLLAESIAGAKSLETQARNVLKDMIKSQQQFTQENQGPEHHNRIFEVTTSQGFKSKVCLSVNYLEGKISFLKSPNEAADSSNTSDQSKVLQLVKSKTNIKRLELTLESKPTKEFEFDDGKTREVFCQLVQHMKNKFSKTGTKNPVSIFVGTWNMGNANPQTDLRTWLKCQGHGKTRDSSLANFAYDVYAFGTQECPVSEKDWIARIKKQLGNLFSDVEFYCVSVCTLWSIRLVVFANQSLKNMISHVQQSSVKTGIANALGNKGGVGISFCLGPVSLCFINCHLAARSERLQRRKQDYLAILNGLNLGQKSVFGITEQFHHVFLFGDLNYRIDMAVQDVLGAVKCSNFAKLKHNDQLQCEKRKGNIFVEFVEDPITFPPTYRYKRSSNEYVWKKTKRSGVLINVPSWCDRVLRHSFPGSKVACTSYGCTDNLTTSDHWPVFCSYDVTLPLNVTPDQAIPKSPGKGDCKIVFHCITARIKTNSKTQFYIEFHSSCLEKMQRTEQNNVFESRKKTKLVDPETESAPNDGARHAHPEWSQRHLPVLRPIISERHYLESQHLFLAVKSVDNDESYGECCIALGSLINVLPQSTDRIVLTHSGEKTGAILLEMHVTIPENSNEKRTSQFPDLIRVGDLEESKGMPRKGSLKSPRTRHCQSLQPQVSLPLFEQSSEHSKEAVQPVPPPKRHSAPQVEIEEDKGPPPLPAKRAKPKTVEEMMQKIGFPQYTQKLVEYGWDNLEFLNEITETDLEEASIPKTFHRKIIAGIMKFTA